MSRPPAISARTVISGIAGSPAPASASSRIAAALSMEIFGVNAKETGRFLPEDVSDSAGLCFLVAGHRLLQFAREFVADEGELMNREVAARLVAPFYDALNQPASTDVAALVESVASADWRSYSGEAASKGRDEFKDVFGDGDRVIVRSEASGTPVTDFMGVPHAGKRFAIMTIDIPTVRDGKLIAAHLAAK